MCAHCPASWRRFRRNKIHALYREMAEEALKTLTDEGVRKEDIELSYAVDLKYVGQFHEVTIPFKSRRRKFRRTQERLRCSAPPALWLQFPGSSRWRRCIGGCTASRPERTAERRKSANSIESIGARANGARLFSLVGKSKRTVFDGARLAPSHDGCMGRRLSKSRRRLL